MNETVAVPDRFTIDVWSDVICPWCYLGLTYLDRALAEFEHADRVDVVLHSYELDPTAPVRDEVPMVTRIARKYGTSEEQVEASQARIASLGEEVDLDFHFDRTARGNTFDAHRLLHRAREHGVQLELKTALFRAYFTDGDVVGEHDTLRRVAGEVGLPADAVAEVLDTDVHAGEVRADVDRARQMGVSGVPYFLFDGEVGFGGAQPPERMLRALDRLWAERRPDPEPPGLRDDDVGGDRDGDVCGPEGCEV